MENIRFALICVLGVLCFFLYQAWQEDYGSAGKAQVQQQSTRQSAASHPEAEHPSGSKPSRGQRDTDVPSLTSAPSSSKKNAQPAQSDTAPNAKKPSSSKASVLNHGHEIHVVTDKFRATIDTRGGGLRQVELRGVPVSADKPNSDLRLLNDTLPNFFIEQSGLISQSAEAPNHTTQYQSSHDEYRLAPGQKKLRVPLTWHDGDRTVTKIYTFTRGSYRIDLQHKVVNNSKKPWTLSQYVRFWRAPFEISGDVPFSSAFFGVGWYRAKTGGDGYEYQTRSHDELAGNPLSLNQTGGWVAMIQHYFMGAAIPPEDSNTHFFARQKTLQGQSGAFATGFVGEKKHVAPGKRADFGATLFVGPKLQDQLDAVAPGLDLTVDYGFLTVLAKPIFWVLDHLHDIVGNWGVSIILLTFLIKLLFYKLSETQYRAMARMRKFQPRMQQLKEQYGDDRQKLQSKMMELYKKEGFNPLAGCWPMLVQMPVFIALYWVLRESVELRHAPFFLWIQDLSAPDPYYILPVVFGLTMFLQQRLTANVTMDPMQQRMMQIMPVGLAVFFAFFPAGLVLYWCTNNILSIAQQWYIYRKLDAEGLGHKASHS